MANKQLTHIETTPDVLVLEHRYVEGWPENDDKRCLYTPLSVALSRAYPTDAHVTGYIWDREPRRINATLLQDATSTSIRMVIAIFDVDGPDHKCTDEWWQAQQPKIAALFTAHPGALVYRTKGGYRVVYRIEPVSLHSRVDAVAWAALYDSWLRYLERLFAIEADPACNQWNRLFRLPFVIRDGVPQNLGGFGDVNAIGMWTPALTDEDRASKATSTATTSSVSAPPKTSDYEVGVALLGTIWPKPGGGLHRKHAALALAGICRRIVWDRERAATLLCDVCVARVGGEDQTRAYRAQQVSTTYDLADTASGQFTGYTTLSGLVTDVKTLDRALTLLGLSCFLDIPDFVLPGTTAQGVVPAPRRGRRADHVYSHTPGVNAPREKLKNKVPMSDIVRFFLGSDAWRDVWQYNEFKQCIEAVNPPLKLDAETTGLSASDVTGVCTWFEAAGMAASDKQITAAILQAAKNNSYHPVREYLLGLPRRPVSGLLDSLATRVLGNPTASANTFLKLCLISAVRRILVPGTKVDTMLVLYSAKEGRLKSTFVETLFGAEWYRDQMPSLDGRDASHALEGSWGIEIPELDRIMRAETSTTKEFLSRRTDKYRAFGTGSKVEYPRQCVFIGTTNYPDFLESDTGNRRFWPIEVFGTILLDFIRAHRDAIWAEAVTLALDPTVKHWLDEAQEADAAEIRVAFDKQDAWTERIADYCAGREDIRTATQVYLEAVAVGEDGALAKIEKKHLTRISNVLRKLGCESMTRRRDDDAVERFWRIPDGLCNATPSAAEQLRRTVGKLKFN